MQATVSLKFQHCNFGEHYADATAAYDADPQTAWIAPFHTAQKAYWSAQSVDVDANYGGYSIFFYAPDFSTAYLGNDFADELVATRLTAIYDKAQSAYSACMAGGASTVTAQSTNPVFRLSISTKLDGGTASDNPSAGSGLSTQLRIPFAPIDAVNAMPNPVVPWEPFHRIGPITRTANGPGGWDMSFDDEISGSHLGFPMHAVVGFSVPWLHTIDADFVQCLPYPPGMGANPPENRAVPFEKTKSFLSVTVYRQIRTPDGVFYDYTLVFNKYDLDNTHFYVSRFPDFYCDCDVSGTVEVRHVVIGYAAQTDYFVNTGMETAYTPPTSDEYSPDGSYVGRAMRPIVKSDGHSVVFGGEFNSGFNYIHQSFEYVCLKNKLGIVRLSIYSASGAFIAWSGYLVWLDAPEDVSGLSAYRIINTPLSGTSNPIGSSINVTFDGGDKSTSGSGIVYEFDLPIIEDVSALYVSYVSEENIFGYYIISGGPTSHIYTEFETPKHIRLVVRNTLSYGYSTFLTVVPDFYL